MDIYAPIRSLTFPTVAPTLGIDLKRFKLAGNGEWAGYCPVHQSKTNQSCFRYATDGKFHCFSCNAKGRGALDLAKLVKALGFKQAVELLQPLVGSEPQPDIKKQAVEPAVMSGDELKPFTGKYHLHSAECDWLNARCPDKAVRERYGVFFYSNPARKSQVNNHVLIPIRDREGVNYGYLARNIGEVTADKPKYRFPANLPKSRFVFGADQLQVFGTLPLRVVYLLESPLACLKFASMGLPAVSPFGWAVSEEQTRLLQGLTKCLIYIPDRNKSQETASVVQLLARSIWLRCPPLPEGIDDPEQMTKEQVLSL